MRCGAVGAGTASWFALCSVPQSLMKCNAQQLSCPCWGQKVYSRPPAVWLARRHSGAASRRRERELCAVDVRKTADYPSTSGAGKPAVLHAASVQVSICTTAVSCAWQQVWLRKKRRMASCSGMQVCTQAAALTVACLFPQKLRQPAADADGSTRQLSQRGAGPSNGAVGLEERRRDFDEAAPERFPYHRQAPAPCLYLVCLG